MGRLTNLVLLATVLKALTITASLTSHEPFSTRNTLVLGRGAIDLELYHPPSIFETFGDGVLQPSSVLHNRGDPPRQAQEYVVQRLRVQQSEVGYRSGYERSGIRYSYLSQIVNGLPVANAVSNVAFKDDKVVSFGSSFMKPGQVADPSPSVSLASVLEGIEEILDGKYNGHPPRLVYLVRPDGSFALVHGVQIGNVEANTLYEAFVDAHSGVLLSATDFSSEASYRVLPPPKQFLPEGVELVADPQDDIASPAGWHKRAPNSPLLGTSGNNVFSWKGSPSNVTLQSSEGTFDYIYDPVQAPNVDLNLNAARTNAFYIANTVHDFAYRYGFTEAAFNFQDDNFGKGGLGNDRVNISVQDSSSVNNANFLSPPDGQPGFCRMYIWTLTQPNRDGSLSNDILIHELAHGISNRLTGGGTSACLQTLEARALGEGWSDAIADWALQKSANVTDFVVAAYTENKAKGIRMFPYSTNMTTFPHTYSTINRWFAIYHWVGEVWANILHNVYAALVAEHGWAPDALTNPDGSEGNVVFMHLLMDGLALQPCNPTFQSARDAWLQADSNRYGGLNRCLLWRAFASRGLGPNAANRQDDFAVPSDCA